MLSDFHAARFVASTRICFDSVNMEHDFTGIRICYFCPERNALSDGVFDSQVLTPARFLERWGAKCLVVGAETSIELAAEAARQIETQHNLYARVASARTTLPGVFALWQRAAQAFSDAEASIESFKPTHVYTRSFVGARVVHNWCKTKNVKTVFDCRGAVSEEVRYHGPGSFIYKSVIRWLEAREMRRAGRLTCVSQRLNQYVEHLSGRRDVGVIPCCVDPGAVKFSRAYRDSQREMHGFAPRDVVLCYAGGLSHWQRVQDTVLLMQALSRVSDRFRFIFLTKEVERAKRLMSEAGLPLSRVLLKHVPHSEVGNVLSLGDVGVILRHDIVLNRVASPIKVPEYLSSGLMVLLSSGVGDYSEMLPAEGLGVLVPEGQIDAAALAEKLLGFDYVAHKEKAIDFARRELTWDAYRGPFHKIYSD